MDGINGHSNPDSTQELDALVVGAGFAGVYQLKCLKALGLRVKLVEAGSDYGGVWHFNRYPGARVDSPVPLYEFSDPDVWKEWSWSQRFVGSAEIRAYFSHVADVWDLRGDTIFNQCVRSAVWDDGCWNIQTNGCTFRTRFFLPNVGFAAKRHVPEWDGIDRFQGVLMHSSAWPELEPDLRGKKVAVIGTGSSGVQLCQELAPLASQFVLFQRTPNMSLPMGQEDYTHAKQKICEEDRHRLHTNRKDTFGGLDHNFMSVATFEHGPAERERTWEKLWSHGDFHFWLAGYYDMLFSDEANTEAYNFWRRKVRGRIDDPRLQEIFAPAIKPHPFGCKRVSLENGFYELFERPNVNLVDVNETPIVEVTEKGIKTSEREWEFDVIVCATGFDAFTGGLLKMNVIGKDGSSLADKWKDGVKTHMGLCVSGFPNMFFAYGPQAPSAFCNGPTCAEIHGDWVTRFVEYTRDNGIAVVDAKESSQAEWAEGVRSLAEASLLPKAKSWYMGDNIPGKRREPLVYLGGVPKYIQILNECAAQGYKGFTFD